MAWHGRSTVWELWRLVKRTFLCCWRPGLPPAGLLAPRTAAEPGVICEAAREALRRGSLEGVAARRRAAPRRGCTAVQTDTHCWTAAEREVRKSDPDLPCPATSPLQYADTVTSRTPTQSWFFTCLHPRTTYRLYNKYNLNSIKVVFVL